MDGKRGLQGAARRAYRGFSACPLTNVVRWKCPPPLTLKLHAFGTFSRLFRNARRARKESLQGDHGVHPARAGPMSSSAHI